MQKRLITSPLLKNYIGGQLLVAAFLYLMWIVAVLLSDVIDMTFLLFSEIKIIESMFIRCQNSHLSNPKIFRCQTLKSYPRSKYITDSLSQS